MQADTRMTLLEAIARRRSVRAYTGERVDAEVIRALLDAAVLAPTAMHEEPWVFAVVQDPARLRAYSDGAKAAFGDTQSAHTAKHLARFAAPEFDLFHGAGNLVVIYARPLGPFVDADCWLAAENLMLTAVAYGLGTCCIGLAVPWLDLPDVKAELGLSADMRAVAPIVVGVPSGATPAVPRRPPEVRTWS